VVEGGVTSIYPIGAVYPMLVGGNAVVVAAADTPSKLKSRADFICDGTSATGGDEAEINAALSMADTVILCPGTYWLSGSIRLGNNQTLQGSGLATVLKLKDNYNADISLIVAISKSRVTIANLTVDGNKANQTDGEQYGIYFENTTNSKIESCHIMNMMGGGIFLVSSSNNVIAGNICQNNDYDGIFLFDSSNNNTVTGNTCQNNGGSGILLTDSSNNRVTGNTCQNNFDGISLIDSSNNAVAGNTCQNNGGNGISLAYFGNNTVTGNICQNNGFNGIYLFDSSNNTVAGNTCQDNDSCGILLVNSSNNTVTGNTCQNNSYDGIYLGGSSNNTVAGNTCHGNGASSTSAYSNIYLCFNSDYNLISGNICRHDNVSRYGINIASSDCDYNMIEGNNLYASGLTGDINDAGTNTRKRDNLGNTGEWLTDV